MNLLFLALLGCSGAPGHPGSPDPGPEDADRLYDPTRVQALAIGLTEEAMADLVTDPFSFVPATLVCDGETLIVAVRSKGNSTWSPLDEKPSLIVDVGAFVTGQELHGHTRFNLHNLILDPSRMSETLSYAHLRAAGLPGSRTGYARLDVNGADYGLYAVVEPIRDAFLERWFADPNGNLYEAGLASCDLDTPGCFETEETDEGDHDALIALSADMTLEGDAWLDAMRRRFDGDTFVRGLAFDALIARWDGYAHDRSNYHLYHDPTADKWTFIAQSMDLDYGWNPFTGTRCGEYGLDPMAYTEGILGAKCLGNDTCRDEFEAALVSLAGAWEEADPVGQIDALDLLLRDEIPTDTRGTYDEAAYDEQVACLRTFAADRPEAIRTWASDPNRGNE